MPMEAISFQDCGPTAHRTSVPYALTELISIDVTHQAVTNEGITKTAILLSRKLIRIDRVIFYFGASFEEH